MAKKPGMNRISAHGVTLGRNPWRSMRIPSHTPTSPMTSIGTSPMTKKSSVHGV